MFVVIIVLYAKRSQMMFKLNLFTNCRAVSKSHALCSRLTQMNSILCSHAETIISHSHFEISGINC